LVDSEVNRKNSPDDLMFYNTLFKIHLTQVRILYPIFVSTI